MKNLLKITVFSLLVIGFFAGYANFGIPKIKPAPPPVEEEVDLGAMTMDKYIALGGNIYEGKGTCTLCHNELGGRAPVLNDVAAVAVERISSPDYQGDASTAEEYISESMTAPSTFVVTGFGKAGTNDSESPMPDVTSGGIGLSEIEINAVVAYLQDLAGEDVTVTLPTLSADDEEADDDEEEEEPRAFISDPVALLEEFNCLICHVVAGEGGDIGPDLSHLGSTKKSDYIRRAIMLPNADVAEGYEADMMPDTLGEELYAGELEILVKYLAELK